MSNQVKEDTRKLMAELREAGKDNKPVLAVAGRVERFITELRHRITAQVDELTKLRTTLDTRSGKLATAERTIQELQTQVHSLTQRLTNLENRPKLLAQSQKMDEERRHERRRNRVRFDAAVRFEDAPAKTARANALFIAMVGIGGVPPRVREEDFVFSMFNYVADYGLRVFLEDLMTVLIQSADHYSADINAAEESDKTPPRVLCREAPKLPQPRVKFAARTLLLSEVMDDLDYATGVALNPVLCGVPPFPALLSIDSWVDISIKYVNARGLRQYLTDIIFLLRKQFGGPTDAHKRIPFGYSTEQLTEAGIDVMSEDGSQPPPERLEVDDVGDLSRLTQQVELGMNAEIYEDEDEDEEDDWWDCECDDDCPDDCACPCHDEDDEDAEE